MFWVFMESRQRCRPSGANPGPGDMPWVSPSGRSPVPQAAGQACGTAEGTRGLSPLSPPGCSTCRRGTGASSRERAQALSLWLWPSVCRMQTQPREVSERPGPHRGLQRAGLLRSLSLWAWLCVRCCHQTRVRLRGEQGVRTERKGRCCYREPAHPAWYGAVGSQAFPKPSALEAANSTIILWPLHTLG